jgi:hypothetical protein
MLMKLVASLGPSGSPTSEDSFSVVEIGVQTGLQEFMPALFTKSIAYFLCDNNMPSLILDTSITKILERKCLLQIPVQSHGCGLGGTSDNDVTHIHKDKLGDILVA